MLPFVVSPACHARPENIWKEQVIGAVQGMVEETDQRYGASGQVAAGQVFASLRARSTKER